MYVDRQTILNGTCYKFKGKTVYKKVLGILKPEWVEIPHEEVPETLLKNINDNEEGLLL